jgi:N-acetylneuraminic acid mutarotase
MLTPGIAMAIALSSMRPHIELRFNEREPIPLPRVSAAGATLGNRIFILGGIDSTGVVTASVQSFDVGKDSWATYAPLTMGRALHGAAAVNGRLYVFGGTTSGGPTRTVEIYEPSRNAWTFGPEMPIGRWGHSALGIGNDIFLVGGYVRDDQGSRPTPQIDVYSTTARSWRSLTPLKESVHQPALVTIGAEFYILGGRTGAGRAQTATARCLAYNPRTGSTRTIPPLSTARAGAKAIRSGKYILLVGGVEAHSLSSTIEVYSINGGTWKTVSVPGPLRRDGHVLLEARGRLFMVGGTGGSTFGEVVASTLELVLDARD